MSSIITRPARFLARVIRQQNRQIQGIGIVGLLAIVWALMSLGTRPFNIFDNEWLWGDLGTVYLAWCKHMGDPDAWGLMSTIASDPIPLNFALFDPMPILMVPAKLIAWIFPAGTQYFGFYFLLCLFLQGLFGYFTTSEVLELHKEPDVDRKWGPLLLQLSGAVLCMTMPITLNRLSGHTALSSQWLLIMSIWIALRTRDSGLRAWLIGNCAMLFLATGFNPYLAVMVGISLSGMAFMQTRLSNWQGQIVKVAALAATGLAGLWFFGFTSGAGVAEGGYGVFSMNMLGPIDSNGFATLFALDIVDPTTGQTFEGFNYLGLGVILQILAMAALLYRTRIDPRLPIVAALLIGCVAYILALSTTITFSGVTFVAPAPEFSENIMRRFRGSGRFFWIGAFWLTIISLAVVARRFPGRLGVTLVVLMTFVQWIDVAGISLKTNHAIASLQRMHYTLPAEATAGRNVTTVKVFPPWQCDPFHTPGGVRNYEIFGFLTLDHGWTTNSFYAARTPANQRAYHCDYAARLSEMDPTAIYFLSNVIHDQFSAEIGSRLICKADPELAETQICWPAASD
ncbi:MAG: DUF6311 domain-containing protein [Hyphomonas sp.]|uniref:DUF6311 domain-containing protein n=1 Tax=Hyphomonas sp. TaxID=87 RepID=UPI003297C452